MSLLVGAYLASQLGAAIALSAAITCLGGPRPSEVNSAYSVILLDGRLVEFRLNTYVDCVRYLDEGVEDEQGGMEHECGC